MVIYIINYTYMEIDGESRVQLRVLFCFKNCLIVLMTPCVDCI